MLDRYKRWMLVAADTEWTPMKEAIDLAPEFFWTRRGAERARAFYACVLPVTLAVERTPDRPVGSS